MQTKQYTTIDKSAWPRGPWDHEPDAWDVYPAMPAMAFSDCNYRDLAYVREHVTNLAAQLAAVSA